MRRLLTIAQAALLVAVLATAVTGTFAARPAIAAEGWIELFNGRDLTGWTAKIAGYPLGDNFANNFRVEDGLLKVRYDGYDRLDDRFGHLFWKEPYSRYRLLVEYRFVGEQLAGGPDWARRNSGVMIHAQDPATMQLDQPFPASLEAQFLGGLDDGRPRPTGNLCTPGTDVMVGARLYTPHCLQSSTVTVHGDAWVRAEVIVLGSNRITHLINDEVVAEYTAPRLSEPAREALGVAPGTLLERGFIALQSESHPVDFRTVRLKPLD